MITSSTRLKPELNNVRDGSARPRVHQETPHPSDSDHAATHVVAIFSETVLKGSSSVQTVSSPLTELSPEQGSRYGG